MNFDPIDFNVYNKPPYYPQYLSRGEAKKLVSFDDDKYAELDRLIDKTSDQYDLDRAKGILLDRIGKLVDESRDGNDDELYRLLIRLRILLNTTNGSINDIIKVIKFIFSSETVIIQPNYPAGLSILHDGESPSVDFNKYMSHVVPAGVAYDTKELFFFTDDVNMTEKLLIIVHRKDIESFGNPIKFNGAIKFDGCTRNEKISVHGKFDGSSRFNGDIKFDGTGKTENPYLMAPPFKFSSGIKDVLDITFQNGNFVDTQRARLCFDGSVRFDGGSKFNGISQYPVNDALMGMESEHTSIENVDPITESLEAAAVTNTEEDTLKTVKFDGSIKFNGKRQFTNDYADQMAMDLPGGDLVDDVALNEDVFVGMRKHHFFNGAYRFDGSIKFDGMALIPMG